MRAIEFIERQQHDDGGWRYSMHKQERSDVSVSGWAMLALKSAREAEIPVSQDTIESNALLLQVLRDGRPAGRRTRPAPARARTRSPPWEC